MPELIDYKREDYLEKCTEQYESIRELDREYLLERSKRKEKFAETFEEGRLEADLQVAAVANNCGVQRQTINKMLVDVFGVRHPDKARAAQIGHESRKTHTN